MGALVREVVHVFAGSTIAIDADGTRGKCSGGILFSVLQTSSAFANGHFPRRFGFAACHTDELFGHAPGSLIGIDFCEPQLAGRDGKHVFSPGDLFFSSSTFMRLDGAFQIQDGHFQRAH